MNSNDNAPRSADYKAGYDQIDPYDGEDITDYPGWWQENIHEFRSNGMRPYRPPQFSDGTVVPTVISQLESELRVEIDLRVMDPSVGDNWNILLNGQEIAPIGRERLGEGYTEFKLTSDAFEQLIIEQLESGD